MRRERNQPQASGLERHGQRQKAGEPAHKQCVPRDSDGVLLTGEEAMPGKGMHGLGEFRQHWRVLLAAFLGLASALSLNSYILSTFAPYMIAEFAWSRSQWALLGLAHAVTLISLPIAG